MTPSLEWLAVLGAMSLLPFLLVVLSSFAKVLVVLGILRNALGIPGVPPGLVLMGVSLVLTGFIMAPVAEAMVDEAQRALAAESPAAPAPEPPAGPSAPAGTGEPLGTGEPPLSRLQALSWEQLSNVAAAAVDPLRVFLARHAHPAETELFVGLSARDGTTEPLARDDLRVLAPAFIVSELKEAFQIGFLIFLPFLVLDLVVANILLGLGMHMLSPTAVSLPFKLLLFVVVDGWGLIIGGLVASYPGAS